MGWIVFGCGKFDEFRVFAFLDGKKDLEIENHIMECDECLGEIIDLNRINSTIEGSNIRNLKGRNFIILRKTKEDFDFFTTLGFSKLKVAGVRKQNNTKNKIWMARAGDIEISISSLETGFEISLDTDKLKNFKVELIRRGETLPVFSKTGSYEKVSIKGIETGKYELKINEEVLFLSIQGKEAFKS